MDSNFKCESWAFPPPKCMDKKCTHFQLWAAPHPRNRCANADPFAHPAWDNSAKCSSVLIVQRGPKKGISIHGLSLLSFDSANSFLMFFVKVTVAYSWTKTTKDHKKGAVFRIQKPWFPDLSRSFPSSSHGFHGSSHGFPSRHQRPSASSVRRTKFSSGESSDSCGSSDFNWLSSTSMAMERHGAQPPLMLMLMLYTNRPGTEPWSSHGHFHGTPQPKMRRSTIYKHIWHFLKLMRKSSALGCILHKVQQFSRRVHTKVFQAQWLSVVPTDDEKTIQRRGILQDLYRILDGQYLQRWWMGGT